MIETLIWIYIVISLSLIFFQCGFIVIMLLRTYIERRKIKRLKREIINQLELIASKKPIHDRHQNYIRNELSFTPSLYKYEKALSGIWDAIKAGELALRDPDEITNVTIYIRHRAKKEEEFSKGRSKIFMRLRPKKSLIKPLPRDVAENYFREYIRQTATDMVNHSDSYNKKDTIVHTFFVTVLRKYGYLRVCYTSELISNLKDLFETGDCLCRESILLAVYEIGSAELIHEFLQMVDTSDEFLHPKIISDGLLSYKGDAPKLQRLFLDHFLEYTAWMQINLLNYLRFYGGAHCKKVLELLHNEQLDQEVHYACIRYFGKYVYEPAYETIARFADGVEEKPIEYSIVALAVLRRYPSERTREILSRKVSSPNWFIRYNATESLEILGIEYQDLIDIFDGRDRFARDLLQYQFDQRYILNKEAET